MHEVSLCRDLVDMVTETVRDNTVRGIKKIHLRLGAFSHVQAEAMEFCFQAVSEGTVAAGAELIIHQTQAIGRCEQCCRQQAVQSPFEACEACGYFPVNVAQADDMILQSIEVF